MTIACSIHTGMASKPGSESEEKQSLKVQKRVFTKWVNDKLRPSGYKIKDLEKDLDDGLHLIKLMEALAPGKMPGK